MFTSLIEWKLSMIHQLPEALSLPGGATATSRRGRPNGQSKTVRSLSRSTPAYQLQMGLAFLNR